MLHWKFLASWEVDRWVDFPARLFFSADVSRSRLSQNDTRRFECGLAAFAAAAFILTKK
jgi:hypothetical protein